MKYFRAVKKLFSELFVFLLSHEEVREYNGGFFIIFLLSEKIFSSFSDTEKVKIEAEVRFYNRLKM